MTNITKNRIDSLSISNFPNLLKMLWIMMIQGKHGTHEPAPVGVLFGSAVPITVIPAARAICTAAKPTPPLAP